MNRPGFTLIELMLATTLTVMLMAGVLSVITTLQKPMPALDGQGEASSAGDMNHVVLDLISADLSSAMAVENKGAGLEIMSYGGIDPQTGQRTQRPTIVNYRLREVDGVAWLVRDQRQMDTPKPLPRRRELVASGYSRIELVAPPTWQPPELPDESDRQRGDEDVAPRPIEPPITGLWRLRLWTPANAESPAAERTLVLRRDLEKEPEEDASE